MLVCIGVVVGCWWWSVGCGCEIAIGGGGAVCWCSAVWWVDVCLVIADVGVVLAVGVGESWWSWDYVVGCLLVGCLVWVGVVAVVIVDVLGR